MSAAAATRARGGARPGRLRDVLSLTKPRVTLLVAITAGGGLLGGDGDVGLARALAIVLAIAGTAASASALNCLLERDVDSRMHRTRRRPLAAGRLSPGLGALVGLSLGAGSLAVLQALTNPVTVALAAAALVSYVLVYTPLKRVTPLALYAGGVPGALPPLMGRTSVTAEVDAVGLALFGLLFLWQVPHFVAIARYLRDDYARAGLRIAEGAGTSRAAAVGAAVALVPVSLSLVALGEAGAVYGTAALVAGVWFAAVCVSAFRDDHPARLRALMRGSAVYLAAVVLALVVDSLI